LRRFIILGVLFISCYRSGTQPVVERLVNNQDYYNEFHKLVEGANQSIYVCMFVANFKKGTLVEYIYEDLASAVSRGVDVRVLLDSSYYDSSLNAENTAFAESLMKVGVKVCFDTPYPTTHAKFGVFDHAIVLIGSTNWTESALEKNNEVNVVIENRDIAGELEEYFFKIWRKDD